MKRPKTNPGETKCKDCDGKGVLAAVQPSLGRRIYGPRCQACDGSGRIRWLRLADVAAERKSSGRNDDFDFFARSTIIGAQIKTRFFRFDLSQYQRLAAHGAGRPKIVDELKIKRVHNVDSQTPLAPK